MMCAGNVYYPGFKRNFWLEFSSARPETEAAPVSVSPATPRPRFLQPSTNGSIQTVTLGRSTRIDCAVTNLAGYQVSQHRRMTTIWTRNL